MSPSETPQPLREDEARQAPDEALRISEEKLSGIVDISAEGIVSVDGDQRITLFNQGAEAIFGYRAEEVLGRTLDLLIPERHRESHREHLRDFERSGVRARKMGERKAISGRRKDGSEFPAEASISQLEVDGEKVFTAVIRDVTERIRTMENQRFLAEVGEVLASSLELDDTLRSIAELSVRFLADFCAVDLLENHGEVRRLAVAHRNPDMAEVARELREVELERDRPHLVSRALETREPHLVARVTPAHLDEVGQTPEHRALLERLKIQSYMIIPLLARGRLLGALLMVSGEEGRAFDDRDLELAGDLGIRAGLAVDNARLYQEARSAVQARDDTLGVVSHDLGNPLQAIFIALEALEKQKLEGEGQRGGYYLEAIRSSVELMQRLIQELLDVRRMEAGKLGLKREPQSLAPLVREALEVIDPLARVKSVTLDDRVPSAGFPPVDVDGDRIKQVLSNLVGNAVKHAPPGGRVTVEAALQAQEIRVSVRDTGPGIPEEERERVFQRFWRRETTGGKGIGLGLAIAQGIVLAHGGRIWVESEVGHGSVFHFTLHPAGNDPPSPPKS